MQNRCVRVGWLFEVQCDIEDDDVDGDADDVDNDGADDTESYVVESEWHTEELSTIVFPDSNILKLVSMDELQSSWSQRSKVSLKSISVAIVNSW